MLSAMSKDTIYMGEPIELKFLKTEAFNDYFIEAETLQHKLDIPLKYSEEPIDKDNYKIRILWDVPSDIPHDASFNIMVTLKHKAVNTSDDIRELEKLFSVSIYEIDQLFVQINVLPFVKIYGDLKKTYIESLFPFDWVDQGLAFNKGDIFSCKSISKEMSLVVKLDSTQFKIKLWTKEVASRSVSNQIVYLDSNLKLLKPSVKKLTVGLNVLGPVEKNRLFDIELKLINFTDSVQAFKIEQLITEFELSNVGEHCKSIDYINKCISYNPIDVLATQNKHGPFIKLHPSSLRIKLGPLQSGECSIVRLQAVSFTSYVHKIVAIRLRDVMTQLLEDIPVGFYIAVE
eukprot:NODE_16_length_41655_cov_0.272813.p10 type:complete len:345 gc:universal NODE_16_length_41655_cov_0.272813:8822-7788(-)